MKKELISLAAGCFLLYFPYLWCRMRHESIASYGLEWSFDKRSLTGTLAISAVILALLTPAAFYFSDALPLRRTFLQALNFGASGLAAAIIEETFFRGWLQTLVRRKFSPLWAVVLPNCVFAPIHLIAFHDHPAVLLTFFPGLVMGFLRDRYDNVAPSMLFHFLGNVWAIWFYPF